jgi:hypothetical protein
MHQNKRLEEHLQRMPETNVEIVSIVTCLKPDARKIKHARETNGKMMMMMMMMMMTTTVIMNFNNTYIYGIRMKVPIPTGFS